MPKKEEFIALLSLVRLGVGHQVFDKPNQIDWSAVHSLAVKQDVLAVVFDGIKCLPEEQSPYKEMFLRWIGEVVQGYEQRYGLYQKSIAELADFYNSHGYKMMVLKGYACGINWPQPEHRPCGDIDIWLFGQHEQADDALKKAKGIKIDKSQHHHTIFIWNSFTVENHYDFVNVFAHKSSREIERVFKKLGEDDSFQIKLLDQTVYLPSPNLHALFLMRHMLSHFAAENITLRHVLDWAFFVEKHGKDVDWDWFNGVLDEFHMRDFCNCISAICEDDLGFSTHSFYSVQFLPELKEKILSEIISPKYGTDVPHGLVRRVKHKYHRWQDNSWKRELCYDESGFSSFCTGLWAHLIKPKTI